MGFADSFRKKKGGQLNPGDGLLNLLGDVFTHKLLGKIGGSGENFFGDSMIDKVFGPDRGNIFSNPLIDKLFEQNRQNLSGDPSANNLMEQLSAFPDPSSNKLPGTFDAPPSTNRLMEQLAAPQSSPADATPRQPSQPAYLSRLTPDGGLVGGVQQSGEVARLLDSLRGGVGNGQYIRNGAPMTANQFLIGLGLRPGPQQGNVKLVGPNARRQFEATNNAYMEFLQREAQKKLNSGIF